ncbi:protein-L-isoaspartate O-methyltransferase [Falsiroseomonas sp.]|uniref:protein-L-isoaspartate O-methyltransferase family protein n=1 Tax=Falsiroseomonas sp. TaxID=2870721 RepID=UPI00271E7833|nr:protein-L-isoaspartate O-methyltransferase [Falsiroseomonas sp.]MDO9503618.1 protein-L-isoaspartate O-methyltransferase [Falsiroseomonas sp.]
MDLDHAQPRVVADAEDGMATARRFMVDGQLRPNKVTDPRLLAAMGDLPRERFLPPGLAARAYADEDVRLPGARALMQPMAIARLLQLLRIRDGDRLLVLGAGTGYAAAVAASCGARVVAVESDAALLAIARQALGGLLPAGAVTLVRADPAPGHAAGAPYDAILIEGEVPSVPDAIAAQLAEGGRLATVLAAPDRGASSRAVWGVRHAGSFSVTDAFDCATLPLPAFQPAPAFVF